MGWNEKIGESGEVGEGVVVSVVSPSSRMVSRRLVEAEEGRGRERRGDREGEEPGFADGAPKRLEKRV